MNIYLAKWEKETLTGEWEERVCIVIADNLTDVKNLLPKGQEEDWTYMQVSTEGKPRVICPYLD